MRIPGIAKEKIAKPVDGVQVKVVGRLIQQEHVGVAEEGLGEEHPDLLAPLQLGHGSLVQGIGNVQTLQQDGGVAVRRVAVFLAHDAFELAEAHAIGSGQVGLGVEDLALFERPPQAPVAHDHGVGNPDVVEGVLVLGEDPELGGTGDLPALGRQVASQELHERGLARPVGAGQAVAASGGEGGGDVVKENLGAKAHGNPVDRDHDVSLYAPVYRLSSISAPELYFGV